MKLFLAALLLAQQPAVDERKLYPLGPDSQRQEGVPRGAVTKHEWKSRIFEGTVRDYWVYVPAQLDREQPAPLMVFQDGGGYASETGGYRVPVVLDNLIHKKELPPIVGIFINPGSFPPAKEGDKPRSNRSVEYDTLSDAYARFLVEEILPEVGKTVKLTDDPAKRAIGGASSGGICAWTVAWERPDQFRKVLSHVGSFTNIRGGHDTYARIRKAPPKPIRVFLQEGTNDLDNTHGNWPLANKQMEAALRFKKYDYKMVWGEGKHSGVHGGALMPESLRWLWRPEDAPREPEPPKAPEPDEKALFKIGPDSQRQEGVPQGKVTKHEWTSEKVYPGTWREWWLYVPAQYDGTAPAALMVFQDGHAYVDEKGQMRVPVVFDNLIHRKELPVTVGVFVNPGHKGAERPKPGWGPKSNRSVEYDTLSDAYARFLLEELLPEVEKSVKLSADPKQRAICGMSSGGICAFTAAWERPQSFGKVLSHIGSFTNIRGGHAYEAFLRKTPPKPIRVYLQDGRNDLDNEHGNWPLGNEQLAASLKFMKYDHAIMWGEGKHSGAHGGAILPDSLRWLWRD
jgi:enterochelin esterase family protein